MEIFHKTVFQDGDEQEQTECAAAAGSEPRSLRPEPALQDHRRGDVRHFREIRGHQVHMQ